MGNEIIFSCEDFYISFLQERGAFNTSLDEQYYRRHGGPEPKNLPETALCVYETESKDPLHTAFYILYGDHRDAYLKAATSGLDACLEYFISNIDQIGHSSECLTRTLS